MWPELSKGLAELRAGDGTTLLRLADHYGRRDDGTYPDDMEALQVINCVDGDRITDRATGRGVPARGPRPRRSPTPDGAPPPRSTSAGSCR